LQLSATKRKITHEFGVVSLFHDYQNKEPLRVPCFCFLSPQMDADAGAESSRLAFAWGATFGRGKTFTDYTQEVWKADAGS